MSSGAKIDLGPDATQRLVDLYRDDVAALAVLVPSLDIALWPRFGDALATP